MSGILPDKPALVFRLNDNGQGPELLRQVFLEQGWAEHDEDLHGEYEWNLWWRTSRFRTSEYNNIYPWQRLNHYPKSTAITKKDALARNLKRMRCVHGANVFNFSPLSFNLPNDYTKFVKTYGNLRQKTDGRKPLWICKPADLSRGRGIFIFRDLSELLYDCNAVIQEYVDNPLLIGGYKFDLRIYVAVTSFHPLTVYIHEEGIVRFSTEKFDLNSTKNVFAHLTNTSINKHSPGYTMDKESVGPGCKWTLSQLRRYFLTSNINDRMLWRRIVNIVVLTLLIQAPQVPKADNCFELYGFDILIDENLKPWLLEVNFSPSLGSDCLADIMSKKPMLHDLLQLLNFTNQDRERGGANFCHKKASTQSQGGPVSLSSRLSLRNRKNSQQMETGGAEDQDGSAPFLTAMTPRVQNEGDESLCGLGLPLAEPSDMEEKVLRDPLPAQSSRDVSPRQVGERGRRSGTGSKLSLAGDESKERRARRLCPGASTSQGSSPHRKHSLGSLYPTAGSRHISADDILDQIVSGSLNKQDALLDFNFTSVAEANPAKLPSKTTVSAESKFSTGSDESKVSAISEESKQSKISSDSGFSSLNTNSESSSIKRATRLRSLSSNKNLSNSAALERSARGKQQLTPLSSVATAGKGRFSLRSRSNVPSRRNNIQMDDKIDHDGPVSYATITSLNTARSTQSYAGMENKSTPVTTRSCVSVQSGPPASTRKHRLSQDNSSSAHPPVARGSKPSSSQSAWHQKGQQYRLHSFANLRKKVGDFHLVFPFNEATWKTSLSNLEAKVVIRETQLLLKECLSAVSNSKSSSADEDPRAELKELWAPLRPVKDDS